MSRLRRRPRLAAAFALGLALALGATGGALAVSTIRSGHALKAIKVVTETSAVFNSSGSWMDVPSMAVTMTVPSSQKGLFLATFSSEALDTGGACWVRMLVNGVEMPPNLVQFATATNGFVSASSQFVAGPYPAGTYNFTVQFNSNNTLCWLGARTLSVERAVV